MSLKKNYFKKSINLTSTFTEYSLLSAKNYLVSLQELFNNETIYFKSKIAKIRDLVDSPDIGNIFDDFVEDSTFTYDSAMKIYSEMEATMIQKIKEEAFRFINELKDISQGIVNENFNNLNLKIKNSEFSVALNKIFAEIDKNFNDIQDSVKGWVKDSNDYISKTLSGKEYLKPELGQIGLIVDRTLSV